MTQQGYHIFGILFKSLGRISVCCMSMRLQFDGYQLVMMGQEGNDPAKGGADGTAAAMYQYQGLAIAINLVVKVETVHGRITGLGVFHMYVSFFDTNLGN